MTRSSTTLLEIHLATFSCVYDTRTDSHDPIHLTLSITKFVPIKSSMSNIWTIESLYWKLKFVLKAVQIFSSLIERSFIHVISVNALKSLME